ncbi:MAG: hypothetical protein DMG05_21380 [Acidobacteria bacterium]|nr:MAG: hypothetical protein DMG05_21380 [Acidobacteriota bacterium]
MIEPLTAPEFALPNLEGHQPRSFGVGFGSYFPHLTRGDEKGTPISRNFLWGKTSANLFTYGVAFFRRGYLDQAVASFQLAIRDDPDYAEAHYNLGTLYLKKHMGAEARQSLGRAV